MYCPRCGQLQADGNTRFCSRCGFLLSNISPILANNGEIPLNLLTANKNRLFTRRNGLIFSLVWFLIFVLLLTPIAAIMFADTPLEGIIPFFAILGTMGGLIMMILSLFLPSSRANKQSGENFQTNFSGSGQVSGNIINQTALPSQSANFDRIPANDFSAKSQPVYAPPTQGNWRAPVTGELVAPPSVVEDTTKLLNEQK